MNKHVKYHSDVVDKLIEMYYARAVMYIDLCMCGLAWLSLAERGSAMPDYGM